jgi:hypothetical protein
VPLLDLTDVELAAAARARRALAYQERQAAKRMENPSTRGPFESAASRGAGRRSSKQHADKRRRYEARIGNR